jgi:putative membrane protein
MLRFVVHWLVITLAVWVASSIVPGVHAISWGPLLIVGLVLGLVNAIVKPVLFVLTLPITVLTLGLFYLVVNGIAFGLACWLVPGVSVDGPLSAILGALVVSIVSWFVGALAGGVVRR